MCRLADMCAHWTLSASDCNHGIALVHTIAVTCRISRTSTSVPGDVATKTTSSLKLSVELQSLQPHFISIRVSHWLDFTSRDIRVAIRVSVFERKLPGRRRRD